MLDYPFYYESIDIDDIFNIPKDLRVSLKKSKLDRMAVDLRVLDEEKQYESKEKVESAKIMPK